MKFPALQKSGSRVANIGVYVIVLLAVVRLLIYPLNATVKDRRAELDEQWRRISVKMRVLDQLRLGPKEDLSHDAERMHTALYPRDASVSGIQADILMKMSELSESKGMSVTGYEMPEAVTMGKITEIPLILRLKGRAEPLIGVLKVIGEQKKVLIIKSMDVSAAGPELTVSVVMQALRSEI